MVLADRPWTLCPSEGTAGEIAPDSIFAFIPAQEHRINGILVETNHHIEPGQIDELHVNVGDRVGDVLLVFRAVHALRSVNNPHRHVRFP